MKINNVKIKFTQVYAPTSTNSEEDMEIFYKHLKTVMIADNTDWNIIMGDFSAKLGINIRRYGAKLI